MGVLKRKQENEAINFKLPVTAQERDRSVARPSGKGRIRYRRNNHRGHVAAVQADESGTRWTTRRGRKEAAANNAAERVQ